ncbi:MAG: hypothetical protein U0361_17975 [Nitrospiraceae bacterium]
MENSPFKSEERSRIPAQPKPGGLGGDFRRDTCPIVLDLQHERFCCLGQ